MSFEKGKEEYDRFCELTEKGKAVEALEFLDRACMLDNKEALVAKAKLTGFDDEESLSEYRRLLERACEAGSGEAWAMKGDLQLLLPAGGEEIFELQDGVAEEKKKEFVSKLPYVRKFDCYAKAAELGFSDACLFLGEMLQKPEYSFLAERDAKKEAAAYYARGAEGGNPECILRLAECLEEGIGVDKDVTKAITLYKELADKGNKNAMLHLCEIYSEGREGVEPDKNEAMKYIFMTGLSF